MRSVEEIAEAVLRENIAWHLQDVRGSTDIAVCGEAVDSVYVGGSTHQGDKESAERESDHRAGELRRIYRPLLLLAVEQALKEFKADGMPPTTVSEERLAEIRGWADLGRSRRAEGRVDGSAIWHVPINRSDDPIVDLLAHIDVLEARIRDMSQDDVGEAWKAGHREGRESVTREMRGAASRLRSMHSQRAVPVGVGDVLVVGEVRMEGQKADVDALMSLLGVPHQ